MDLEKLKNEITIEDLKEMLYECVGYDGSFEDLDYQENDEYFFENYFSTKDDVARAVCYGDYNYMDDFVRFNAYGNLESCNEYEYESEIKSYSDEIVERYIELYSEKNVYPSDELKTKLKNAESEDDDEE